MALHCTPNNLPQQAPKPVPNQAKQNTILAYLQSSLTVHSIKDLEKTLPSVASINGMQVKDFLQALSDEGHIRVEKIGSGNWYWSFASEAKKERTDTMGQLRKEKAKVDASLGEMDAKVKGASALRGHDPDREGLIERRLVLEGEVEVLKKELEGYKDGDPGEVERRRKEIRAYRMKAERWTDNIQILEGQMLSSVGGDREKLDRIKREVYGDEYVEEEGLREL